MTPMLELGFSAEIIRVVYSFYLFSDGCILEQRPAPWIDDSSKDPLVAWVISLVMNLIWKKKRPKEFNILQFLVLFKKLWIMCLFFNSFPKNNTYLSLPPSLSLALCLSPLTQHIVAEVRMGNVRPLLLYSYRSAEPYRTTAAGTIDRMRRIWELLEGSFNRDFGKSRKFREF